VTVAHKAGWISSAKHDAGLVYWHGGVYVVAVMTHGYGVGTASDALAGRVAQRTLDVLRTRTRAVRKRNQANALSPGNSSPTPGSAVAAPSVFVALASNTQSASEHERCKGVGVEDDHLRCRRRLRSST
jgi:hypothetical protein